MPADIIMSLDLKRARRRDRSAADARAATALWSGFVSGSGDTSGVAEELGERPTGGEPLRLLLVLISLCGTLFAVTALLTIGWPEAVGIYAATIIGIGGLLWRGMSGVDRED